MASPLFLMSFLHCLKCLFLLNFVYNITLYISYTITINTRFNTICSMFWSSNMLKNPRKCLKDPRNSKILNTQRSSKMLNNLQINSKSSVNVQSRIIFSHAIKIIRRIILVFHLSSPVTDESTKKVNND